PAEGTCKESAMVFMHFRLDHERALQLGFCKNQDSPAALRISLISFSLAARRPSRMSASEGWRSAVRKKVAVECGRSACSVRLQNLPCAGPLSCMRHRVP